MDRMDKKMDMIWAWFSGGVRTLWGLKKMWKWTKWTRMDSSTQEGYELFEAKTKWTKWTEWTRMDNSIQEGYELFENHRISCNILRQQVTSFWVLVDFVCNILRRFWVLVECQWRHQKPGDFPVTSTQVYKIETESAPCRVHEYRAYNNNPPP